MKHFLHAVRTVSEIDEDRDSIVKAITLQSPGDLRTVRHTRLNRLSVDFKEIREGYALHDVVNVMIKDGCSRVGAKPTCAGYNAPATWLQGVAAAQAAGDSPQRRDVLAQ